MFYDNSHCRFLFSIQSLYEQCAFCTAPPCYYLFMKISRGYWTVVIFYVPLSFFLSCSRYLLFSVFPNLANLPSEWDQLVADLDLRWGRLSPSPNQTCFFRKTLRDRVAGRFLYALPPLSL